MGSRKAWEKQEMEKSNKSLKCWGSIIIKIRNTHFIFVTIIVMSRRLDDKRNCIVDKVIT